ncbi:MAG: DDE-type integrase/transposase/recombinase [Bacteroidota bacterium]|nr:DDE-type integrase/transposase/recombinase [Bacteroidota bacterium]
MVQVDFSRSVYLERIEEGNIPKLRIAYPKGANAKKDRVWIGAGIDDCSRTAYARYFLAKGESSQLAQRLVLKIFSKKEETNKHTGEITPLPLLQGIPKRLYTDKGSAFRNIAFRSGVKKLGIQHILGDMESDTQGKKKDAPNKQARGKIERFIRSIKDDFEASLFLKYRAGTTFTLKEINTLFRDWLMKVNSDDHPEGNSLIKWNIFSTAIESAVYPDDESALMFTTSIFCKVIRRQVRVASGIWCRVPDEINTGETIEILTLGGNYYTPLDGKRVLLQPISKKTEKPEEGKPKEIQTFPTDYLEGVRLRSALNEEIEKRTRHVETIGTLSEKNASEIEEFLSERRMIKEVRSFAQGIIARSKETGSISISPDGTVTAEAKTNVEK